MGECMDVWTWTRSRTHQQGQRKKGSQKARTKERRAIKREEAQKERKLVAVERLLMDSVPTVMSMDIGAENVPTWLIKLGNRSLWHPIRRHLQQLQWQKLPTLLQFEGFSIWKSCSFLKPVFTNFSSFLQWLSGAHGSFPRCCM